MKIKDAVIDAIQKTTEIDRGELLEAMDLDLLENGILDSLSIVTLLAELTNILNKTLLINDFKSSDFRTITSITKAIERLL